MSHRTSVSSFLLVLLGCAPAERQQLLAPRNAAEALATVHGRFAEVGDGAFILQPANAADGSVLRQVSAFNESVVPALINCLADTSPSGVEYAGTPTSLGAVCYWALINTDYVQARIERGGDANPAAAGWLNYREIDPDQQRHARAAWRAWFARQHPGE